MYRINTTKNGFYKTQNCDAASAKKMMHEFLIEKGWHIKLPIRSLDEVERRTLNPSVSHDNFAYSEEGICGVMAYDKQRSLLRIVYTKSEDNVVVKDNDFVQALAKMLQDFTDNGYECEKYYSGYTIRNAKGEWVYEIRIEHYRRLRNKNGEIFEQVIPFSCND